MTHKSRRRKNFPTEQELRDKWLGNLQGPSGLTEDVVAARIARARDAATRGLNISKWAAEEGVSVVAASLFLRRNDVPEDVGEALKHNHHANAPPAWYYFWMLKCVVLAEAGIWSAEELAEKSGVHPTTLANVRKRKVPDGNLREALELVGYEVMGDDDEAEEAVRSFYRQVRREAEGVTRRQEDRMRHRDLTRRRRVAYANAEMVRKNKARRFLETNLA